MISLTRSAEEVDHYETPSTQDELWAYGHTSTQQPITTTLLHSCHPINFMPGETRYLSSTLLSTNACQCIIYGATICSDWVPK